MSVNVASAGPQSGDAVYCITATGRANSGVLANGAVLYSSAAPTTATGWDGRLNKVNYLTGATGIGSPSVGGYCKADGTSNTTYSP